VLPGPSAPPRNTAPVADLRWRERQSVGFRTRNPAEGAVQPVDVSDRFGSPGIRLPCFHLFEVKNGRPDAVRLFQLFRHSATRQRLRDSRDDDAECHPTAINEVGTIAGWCELLEQQADPNNFTLVDTRAVIWIGQPYALVLLPRLPDSSQQQALGINNLGEVMGQYQVPGNQFAATVGRTFAWNAVTGIRAVPVLTGHGFNGLIGCGPTGIDRIGRIVGNCADPVTGVQLGFINTGVTTKAIPDVQASESAIFIADISESGLIVGGAEDQTGAHTWIVDGNHLTRVAELDGFFPIRIVNSGAILAQADAGASVVSGSSLGRADGRPEAQRPPP
jgi:hypothetical protein